VALLDSSPQLPTLRSDRRRTDLRPGEAGARRIVGRHVVLRPAVEADIADYERWQDPNLAAHRFDGPWFKDDGGPTLAELCRKRIESQRPPYSRLEVALLDGTHVGSVVVYHKPDDEHMTEVGISIYEDRFWSKGIGYEALALWVDSLFRERGFTRIGFSTWSSNERMMRLGARLGFKLEGTIRNGCEVEGRFYDRLKFGLLRSEWQALRPGWPVPAD
jgi:RimJ/RimL family protein N-acetyltransferase